ncbi:MAG: hypothetical protein ACOYNI_12280, partial [Acidimicrobiia bacterium]
IGWWSPGYTYQDITCPDPAPNRSSGPAPNRSSGPAPNRSSGPAPNRSSVAPVTGERWDWYCDAKCASIERQGREFEAAERKYYQDRANAQAYQALHPAWRSIAQPIPADATVTPAANWFEMLGPVGQHVVTNIALPIVVTEGIAGPAGSPPDAVAPDAWRFDE